MSARPETIFAALGDPTRLTLVTRLAREGRLSISQLADGFSLTRQAVTKHLRVLEETGMVQSARTGREVLFSFDPGPLTRAVGYLESVSREWDDSLERLQAFVERPSAE